MSEAHAPDRRGFDRLSARYGAVYFCFFGTVGAFSPYFSLYLQSLSFDARHIGELTAVLLGTKVLAPYVWGWLADRSGRRLGIARVGVLLSVLSFMAVAVARQYATLVLALLVFSFFWNAGLPQFEAATMDYLRGVTHRYGRIRLWGSVGFIIAATALGPLFQLAGIALFPWTVMALLVAMWLSMLGLAEPGRAHHDAAKTGQVASVWPVLSHGPVLILLLSGMLMQASHGAYYAFFSIHAAELGYGKSEVGLLWSLGVLAEIGVFLAMSRWLPRFGAARLFQWSLLIASLRWTLIALFAARPPLLILAQVMHAATFGLFHASAIELVHGHFPPVLRGRGQALYSSLSFGLGGALGSLTAGYLWTLWSGGQVFALSAAMAAAGYLIAHLGMQKKGPTSPLAP